MSAIKKIFMFIMFAFTIVTLVGLGILTKAVLGISSKSYYVTTPSPPTDKQEIVDVNVIDLKGSNLDVAKIAVVFIWILLFFCIFGVKIFF
jgi:hypothetical protein